MEALPFLPQQFGEGCQQDQAVRRHLLKGASSESSTEGALGKRTFQRNWEDTGGKGVPHTALCQKSQSHSNFSPFPGFGHQWEVLMRHSQKAAWERGHSFWG